MPDFLSLGISELWTAKLRDFGVVHPTPVQEKAIPHVLNDRDVIAQAQTGTGKTFAFILPILEKIDLEKEHVQALIVTPTRELALQITEEVQKLISDMEGINVLAVYGGQDVAKQLNKLKKSIQIVVGTPGRLLDHIRRETIMLSRVSFLVLDEADQMLHIGFLNEVEDIIRETPKDRQTMLFSATMPPEIRKLAGKHMNDPEYIQVEKKQGPAETVKQLAIHTTDRAKQATLISLVETHRPFLAVIFCRTKRRVSKLYDVLKSNGFSCDELHGDLSQAKREQVMKRFRDAEVQLLVATDVAARGLDVEGVTHVFNYDIPLDSDSYVHRIGRTGRAGMTGLAITFYSSADKPTLELIERELKITIPKQNTENANEEMDKRPSKSKPQRERKPGSKKDGSAGNRGNSGVRDKRGNRGRDNRKTDDNKERRGGGPRERSERSENYGKRADLNNRSGGTSRKSGDNKERRAEGSRERSERPAKYGNRVDQENRNGSSRKPEERRTGGSRDGSDHKRPRQEKTGSRRGTTQAGFEGKSSSNRSSVKPRGSKTGSGRQKRR